MAIAYLSGHRSLCKYKQNERASKIAALPAVYREPVSSAETSILVTPLDKLVANIKKGEVKPIEVLRAYGKEALRAHKETNCLTEIMIADAEKWATESELRGPLAGIPVSLKDTVNVKGYDACIGYSAWTQKPAAQDSGLVRCLKDAGAIPFVKTNVPTSLLSFESYNDVWGRTTNPHNKGYSPGGSSGGESALLASGGSIIGVGTDVAGSVRAPAHFCGIYTIKCSTGRFPRAGNVSNMPGQEGVKACYSPMTRSLDSLSYFLKAVIDQKPWDYDPSCDPIPWRDITLPKVLKIGVLRDDGESLILSRLAQLISGVVRPSPACSRALELAISALSQAGHTIVSFEPPSPLKGLKLASQLLLADGGRTTMSHYKYGQKNELGLMYMIRAMRLPRWVKWIWAKWIRLFGDNIWADLVEDWHEKSGFEQQKLVVQREQYRSAFLQAWLDHKLDLLLTVPNATPAVPNDGLGNSFGSCGYTFLFNLVDYPAGVIPVTKVDPSKDALPKDFKPRNHIEKGAYKNYQVEKMIGLPVGVQIIGRRLEEEWTLKGMELVEDALHKVGVKYVG